PRPPKKTARLPRRFARTRDRNASRPPPPRTPAATPSSKRGRRTGRAPSRASFSSCTSCSGSFFGREHGGGLLGREHGGGRLVGGDRGVGGRRLAGSGRGVRGIGGSRLAGSDRGRTAQQGRGRFGPVGPARLVGGRLGGQQRGGLLGRDVLAALIQRHA